MAWTTPRTWVAGETVTAALMNAHVRDNLIAVHDTEAVAPSRLTGYPTDVTKVLKGDGTWATIVNSNISASAAIAASKLASYPTDATKLLKGDGTWATLVNADVNASAAIVLSKLAQPLWVELQYTEITADVTVASSTEGSPTTVVQGASLAVAARPLLVEFFAPYSLTGDPANDFYITLWEGATHKGRLARVYGTNTGPLSLSFRYTPGAASYVYKIGAHYATGGGTISAGAGGSGNYTPAFLRISQASA